MVPDGGRLNPPIEFLPEGYGDDYLCGGEIRDDGGRARGRDDDRPVVVCHADVAWKDERAAAICSLIETAKLNGLDPETHLRDILARIADHPIKRVVELLPWNIMAAQPQAKAA
jgi:hypothetical protein